MIFYFSGTGNSAWAAGKLARLMGDKSYDIDAPFELSDVQAAERIGFVFPVYAWGAPEVMIDFVKKLPKTDAFTFGVCTCGSEAGLTMKKFSEYYPLDSSYSLVMPNNYIVGTDIEEEDVILKKIARARSELHDIAWEILHKKRVCRVHRGKMAGIKSSVVNFGFNRFARSTKSFYVTDDCSGCGLCASGCSADAITMRDGKPVWTKTQCWQCLHCINECSQKAIQYGENTAERRRYSIRNYVPYEERV